MTRRVSLPAGVIAILALIVICGCSDSDEPAAKLPGLPGQEIVLATVNGSAITQYDLDQSIRTSLGQASLGMLDADGRKKVLESLVAGRAIAQSQAAVLDDHQKAMLQSQVAAYREQQLIKRYLAANIAAEPVSQQMVEDYYHDHLEQFGQRHVRHYEMISTSAGLNQSQRDKLLPALNHAEKDNAWPALAARLKAQGLPVAFAAGRIDPGVLQPRLRELMAPLKPGKASALTFIDGAAYLVRIVDEKKIPAQSLKDVSARIRKMLLPVQLKKAVKQASDQVLASAQVEYPNK